ncbi:methyl-accepting chemotaxis protein [Pseudomonas jessenii]|uniref:methyl-accepting chemotaxis protein n=1 Tax=Pseudomonas jessenii TaxID=77298 RepID=UPI0038911D99
MLANLSLKNKLLLTIVPLTLLVYLSTIVMVYRSSKASTEELAQVAVEAIAHQQAAEIMGYFDGALHAARMTSDMLSRELVDGQLPDSRIADPMLESLLHNSAQVKAAWWLPLRSAKSGSVFWLRGGSDIQLAPAQQREALLGVMEQGPLERETISSPRPLPGSGSSRPVISLQIPVRQNGRVVGSLGLGFDADQLQQRVAQLRPLGVGLAALTAHDTRLVAHPDPTRVGRLEAETEGDFLGEHLPDMINAVRKGEPLTLRFVSPAMGEEVFMLGVPIVIGDTATPWSFGIALPSAALLIGVKTLALKLLLLGCFSVLLLAGMILLLGRALSSPLSAIVQAIRQLAAGEADLRLRLPVKGSDELASLAKEFNGFLDSMVNLVSQIKSTSQKLQSTSEELQQDSRASGAVVNAQRDEVGQLAAAMQQMAATVEEVAHNAGQAAQITREGDLAVAQGQATVANLSAAIAKDAQLLEQVTALTVELSDASQTIGTVVAVIRDIAEQTNLLALNAAIESARAGEQGRGFAVVADEVRALARRTHSSTEDVCRNISMIQGCTRTVVEMVAKSLGTSQVNVASAQEASEALHRITQMIGQVRDMSQQIATATGQQATTSEQLSRSLVTIADSAESASCSAHQVHQRSQDLQLSAGSLNVLVSRFKL